MLILDGTSFPKQGTHSVGVARQYCGTLGKVANCQVAVTVALWTGVRAWMLGGRVVSAGGVAHAGGAAARQIPPAIRFQEKWRLALTLLRQARAAGFQITAVLGDAEFGDNTTLRRTLHRLKLPYALGISSTADGLPWHARVAVPARKRANAPHPDTAAADRRQSAGSGADDRRAPARSRVAACHQQHRRPIVTAGRLRARVVGSRPSTSNLQRRGRLASRDGSFAARSLRVNTLR